MKSTVAVSLVFALLLLHAGCNHKPGAPAASPATASPATNSSEATGGASANGAAATTEQAAQPAPANVDAANSKEANPKDLITGIQNPNLVNTFEAVRRRAVERPTDWQAQIQYVGLLQQIGIERFNLKQMDKAYETFGESAAVAHRLLDSKMEIPPIAHRMLAAVFYNEACVRARKDDVDGAIVSLEESLKWGFNDFVLMEKDEDLAAVRKAIDFIKKMEEWKLTAHARAVKRAQDELAAASDSFPFDFSLTDVSGNPLKLADQRGKVVLVNIWGTWNPTCRAAIPSFVKLQEAHGKDGFQMIGLNQEKESGEEAPKIVTAFIAQQKINYPCAIADEATLKQLPDEQFPTIVFLDRTGKVRLKVAGMQDYASLEAIIHVLLEEPALAKPSGKE